MSLLGFDAIGRWALGQKPNVTSFVLAAATGSFVETGIAATFTVSEAAAVGAFTLTGVSQTFKISVPEAPGAFAFTGIAAAFKISEAPAVGVFTFNGLPANETVLEADAPGAFVLTGNAATLYRTGDNTPQVYGGIGHFKVALENARQLARITRKTPQPIDRTTKPQFAPVGRSPIAAPAPAPMVAAPPDQAAGAQLAAAQAATVKRRRQEEEFLLLAA